VRIVGSRWRGGIRGRGTKKACVLCCEGRGGDDVVEWAWVKDVRS